MDFKETWRVYTELKEQFDQGHLSADEFEKRVNEMTVTDARENIWQIGVSSGKWYRYDGQNWVEDVPQEFERSSTPAPAQVTSAPPASPIGMKSEPVYRNQNRPRKNPWLIGFLIAGIFGLCFLVVGIGGWLVWSNNLLSLVPATIPSSVPLPNPSATNVVPSPAVPEPTTFAEPGFPPNLVQFQDDFSNPDSGWDDVRADENVNTYYFEDSYVLLINTANYYGWANPYMNFPGDVQVEVDARKISGSQFDEFGLLCRYVENSDDTTSYYYFAIAIDGLGVIYKVDHDEKSLIIADPPKNRSDVIRSADQVNRIRGDCIGNTLTLYVNDEPLVSAVDPSLGNGDVGLRADSETGDTEIRFDNFIVYNPGQ
jgi:hypothetical protein